MTRKKAASAAEKPAVSAPASVIFRTEGQRLFCDVRGTLAAIGDRLGVPRQSVHQWKSGDMTPGGKARERIATTYGIDSAAWERLPLGSLPPTEPDTADGDAEDDAADDSDDDEPSLLEDFRTQLKALRVQLKRPDLLQRDRLALNEAFGKALERRRRYELESEMQEDRIIRNHPVWQRLKRVITDALLAHPAAARDVEAAIESVLESEDYR